MLGALNQMIATPPRPQMLGALTPDVQRDLESVLLVLDDLYAQALGDLVILADIGMDPGAVGELRSELDQYGDAIVVQRADLLELDDDAGAPQWRQESGRIQAALVAFLRRTGGMRQGTLAAQQRRGLWWGLGVAAGALGIGWFVWTQRTRRRKN